MARVVNTVHPCSGGYSNYVVDNNILLLKIMVVLWAFCNDGITIFSKGVTLYQLKYVLKSR
mgnify:CR=1 FL=1